jgi:hypothetical protein
VERNSWRRLVLQVHHLSLEGLVPAEDDVVGSQRLALPACRQAQSTRSERYAPYN